MIYGKKETCTMGLRRPQKEVLERLSSKTLDDRFMQIVREGFNCSPFEAEAVLEAVREVYGPYMGAQPQDPLPGHISLVAVDADKPHRQPGRAAPAYQLCPERRSGCPARWLCRRLDGLLDRGALLERGGAVYRVRRARTGVTAGREGARRQKNGGTVLLNRPAGRMLQP